MIFSIFVLSSVVLLLLTPIATLIRYYSPRQYSIGKNIVLILVTIITWPLVPILLAWHRRDKILLSIFWVAFLVFAVSGCYWIATHVDEYILLEDKYITFVRSFTKGA